jgi:hypothetical protein
MKPKLELLAVIAFASLAWAAYSLYALYWIQQRERILTGSDIHTAEGDPAIRAPGGLWLLGERGVRRLQCGINGDRAEARCWFPEARLLGPNDPLIPYGTTFVIVEEEEALPGIAPASGCDALED